MGIAQPGELYLSREVRATADKIADGQAATYSALVFRFGNVWYEGRQRWMQSQPGDVEVDFEDEFFRQQKDAARMEGNPSTRMIRIYDTE